MATGWYVIVVVILAAAALFYVRGRGKRFGPSQASPPDGTSASSDFVQDRETSRLSHMSADDRAWEAASLERQRARPALEPTRVDESGTG
jgi:hypothetical protein